MEYFLGAIHWLDALTPPIEKHLQHLAETVKAMLKVDGDIHGRSASDVARRIFAAKAIGDVEQRAGDLKQPAGTHVARPNWLLIALGCAALVPLVAGGVWLYRPSPLAAGASCVQERGAKSPPSTTPTKIVFNNKTAAPIKVFWLNFQGERKFYGELTPGAKSGQQVSYVDHLWVVTNAQDDCLGVYKATAGDSEITIGP
jgi:hypothetical protein